MPQFHYAQLRYLSIILLAWIAVFFLTRSALLASHLADADVGLTGLLSLYGIGFVYDLGFLLCACLPLAIYLLLCPRRLWQQQWHRRFLHVCLGHAALVHNAITIAAKEGIHIVEITASAVEEHAVVVLGLELLAQAAVTGLPANTLYDRTSGSRRYG